MRVTQQMGVFRQPPLPRPELFQVFQAGPHILFPVRFYGHNGWICFPTSKVFEEEPEIYLPFAKGQVVILVAQIVVEMKLSYMLSEASEPRVEVHLAEGSHVSRVQAKTHMFMAQSFIEVQELLRAPLVYIFKHQEALLFLNFV